MIILTYHKILNKAMFRQHLEYLALQKYRVIGLDEFYNEPAKIAADKKAVLITFDDGDHSVYDHAFPLLKEFGFPAVLFIVSDLVNTTKPFWWDEVGYYSGNQALVAALKKTSDAERIGRLAELRQKSNKPALQYRQLTVNELKELESGNVAIANHSHTHPLFDKLTNEQVRAELSACSAFLRTNGFRYHDVFAYPNGNFSDATISILLEMGFRFAFLFDHKVTTSVDKPFQISRLSVNDSTPLWKFRLILSGFHSLIVPVSKTLQKLLR